jgi:hypothetical protein
VYGQNRPSDDRSGSRLLSRVEGDDSHLEQEGYAQGIRGARRPLPHLACRLPEPAHGVRHAGAPGVGASSTAAAARPGRRTRGDAGSPRPWKQRVPRSTLGTQPALGWDAGGAPLPRYCNDGRLREAAQPRRPLQVAASLRDGGEYLSAGRWQPRSAEGDACRRGGLLRRQRSRGRGDAEGTGGPREPVSRPGERRASRIRARGRCGRCT